MTPFSSLLLPVVLSAVAVFIIPMIVLMTPWHRRDYVRLPDEDGVMKALQPFDIPPNDYMVPHPGTGDYMRSPEFDAKQAAGPVMFATVVPSGPWSMGRLMGMWFLYALVVSASLALVVGSIVPPGAHRHVVFHQIAVIAWLTHAMGAIPLSIWYRRKWSTTFRNAVDALLYALATGWIFAMLWPK